MPGTGSMFFIFLTSFLAASLARAQSVELAGRFYARSSPSFGKKDADDYWSGRKSNVLGILQPGTRAEILRTKMMPSGNSAFFVKVTEGALKGKEVWFYQRKGIDERRVKVAASPSPIPAKPEIPTEATSGSECAGGTCHSPTQNSSAISAIDAVVKKAQPRFGLSDLYTKAVNNNGKGDDDLYGVRNFRTVLDGLVYRGGANNTYPKDKRDWRKNENPLQRDGLQNLCEQGFDTAIYLYPTNFKSAPPSVECVTKDGKHNKLTYLNHVASDNNAATKKILKMVHERLKDPRNKKPLYLHCWNGWHSSGYMSSVILRQFCGTSANDAVNYWNKNTDGNNKGATYDRIRERIRNYRPDPALAISPEVRKQVCLPTK